MVDVLKYCFGLPEIAYEAGTDLISQGQGRGPLFILAEGSVVVHRGGIEVARVAAPGAILGEMSALLDVPHTATVTAVTDVRVHLIDQARQFLKASPEIAEHVTALLAKRLYDTTTYLVEARQNIAEDAIDVGTIAVTVDAMVHGTGDLSGTESE